MRYSVRAALTTLLVGFAVWWFTPGYSLASVAAIAVMGAFILEDGRHDDGSKEDKDIPGDNLNP